MGGAILASSDTIFLQSVSSNYPGRASIAPIMDLFISLLSLGKSGFKSILDQRRLLLPVFQRKLQEACVLEGLRILPSPNNTISFAISLGSLSNGPKDLSFLGSMLFQRHVSGSRVVVSSSVSCSNPKRSRVVNVDFINWGAHSSYFPESYLTVACAIGICESEVDIFITRFRKCLARYRKLNTFITDDGAGGTEGESQQVVEENVKALEHLQNEENH